MKNNEELIFILNTAELKDGGFEGSFNDFAEELENAGATVSGEYDENGVPVMTVYGIEEEELNNLLVDYGIDSPEDYTAEVESADEFDFDTEIEEVTSDVTDIETEDDEEIEIEDDDEDEEIEIIDDEDDDDTIKESCTRHRPRRPAHHHRVNETKKFKGTANLSEAVTLKILEQVKDNAISARILNDFGKLNEQYTAAENYKLPIPFAGITLDGQEMVMMSESELQSKLKVTKNGLRKAIGQYKSLNESQTESKTKFVKAIKRQKKLVNILESVLAFKSGKLFEDDLAITDRTQGIETPQSEEPQEGQLANLTAITFKVKNADDFIKTLTDNGIPSEALEKVENNNSEKNQDSQTQDTQSQVPAQSAMGGDVTVPPTPQGGDMGGGNPFESMTSRLSKKNKLNEDENTENPFGDTDQPAGDSGVDPLNTESHDNNDEGEEVRLIDTSYAPKVRQILADVYGYSNDDFDNKLGGTIEEDGSENDDNTGSDGAFDADGNQSEEDAERVGKEEEISPEEIFSGLDI